MNIMSSFINNQHLSIQLHLNLMKTHILLTDILEFATQKDIFIARGINVEGLECLNEDLQRLHDKLNCGVPTTGTRSYQP